MQDKSNIQHVAIVGGRVAGASLAIHLARAGKRVTLIDRGIFPSDTMSTHVIYPNTIARLEEMGVLGEVMKHRPPPLYTAWHHQGRMFVAPHTPISGRDWAICVRRITLDDILVKRAQALGVEFLENTQIEALIGLGTDEDPIRGVRGKKGTTSVEIKADIVVGADGMNSTTARLLNINQAKVMPTETMLYYAYWTGAKAHNTQDFFFEPPWVCAHFPADDDHHVVTMNGPAALRNGIKDLESFYLDRIRSISNLWARLEGATKVSRVLGSTRLDGFYRQHVGPGWALTGDAAHFKHPAGAQGISDAFQAAEVLASGIRDGSWQESYPSWRDRESREFYAFTKHLAEPPSDEGVRMLMDTFIADAGLARSMVDIWARSSKPWTDVIPFVPGMASITGSSIQSVLAALESPEKAAEIA